MIAISDAMSFIAATVSETALPLSAASAADLCAISSVCRALSAFCLLVVLICVTDVDASSADAACADAPCDLCPAPEESCRLPDATLVDALFPCATTDWSLPT